MEVTLLDDGYLGLTLAAARERIVRLAAVCQRFGGTFRLLWHNYALATRGQRQAYQDIVAEIAG
jgi:hypothetical protein